MLSHTLYIIYVNVTNPSTEQAARALTIEATGTAHIGAAGMDAPHAPLLGVVNGSDPLRVVVPALTTRAVAQSMPIAGRVNTVRVSLCCSASALSWLGSL